MPDRPRLVGTVNASAGEDPEPSGLERVIGSRRDHLAGERAGPGAEGNLPGGVHDLVLDVVETGRGLQPLLTDRDWVAADVGECCSEHEHGGNDKPKRTADEAATGDHGVDGLVGLHRLETAYTQWSRAWIAVSLRPFRLNRGFGAPAASREAIPFPAQALGDRFEIAQDRFADALLS